VDIKFPLHRFEEFGKLEVAELEAVAALGDQPRRFRRHARIRAEGVPTTNFFLLVDGWVASSHILPDGRRQILKVHLPGDALGTPSMCMARTAEELTALTDAVVIDVPLDRFGMLFESHPRLAARFLLSVQLERVALMDRLASISRTSGQQRVAALILDLMERLEPLGLVHNGSFHMVLTQEQIGDVVGLTSVHTNRSLGAIEKQGLIARSGQRLTVIDRDELARFSARSTREVFANQAWLPKPRDGNPGDNPR
jgi:CRP/FNR family transcriptional regulator, anaerobic regulatory protein